MNQLDQIENRIKEIIEKGSDLLPWSDQGAVLVDHFCVALRQFIQDDPSCLQDSPSELRVYMSADEKRLWQQQSGWEKILQNAFLETVVELDCKPDLLPVVTLLTRNSLQNGELAFGLEESTLKQEKTGAVNISRPHKKVSSNTGQQSAKLLIDLNETIPIDKTIINIGRKSANDITINDMRVSRLHAQLRKTREGYIIFDVGSTGGTFVNGERITSQVLRSGDVISLAGYKLVFTNENHSELEDEREITSDLSSSDELK